MLSTIDENLRFSRPHSLSHPRDSMSFLTKYGLNFSPAGKRSGTKTASRLPDDRLFKPRIAESQDGVFVEVFAVKDYLCDRFWWITG
jgi:hypothetical protein